MKRCPECRRDYTDETLNYCLDDGTALLEGPASLEGSATAILGEALVGSWPSSGNQRTELLRNVQAWAHDTSNSIAVLPFANVSADADNEFFCHGLAEELLLALTKIDDLKVAARTSAFSFQGKNVNVSEIGRILNVKTVLEGSVRKEGTRVRIAVQLINAANGYHIWSERYDREMSSIFEVQDEITLAVVDALKLKLLGNERAVVLKRYTENPEVYELYLKGRFHHQKYTPEDWMAAIDFLEQAIALEPEYAPAYASLASVYAYCWFFDVLPSVETAAKWLTATKRVLLLDPDLDEAHGIMARFHFYYERNWDAAEREFLKALQLNSVNAEIWQQYSVFLAVVGRKEKAIECAGKALELDPLSLMNNLQAGWVFLFGGDTERVLAICRRMLEMEPNFHGAYWQIGLVHISKNEFEQALEAFQKSFALAPTPNMLSHIGAIYGDLDKNEEAAAVADQLIELRKQQPVAAYHIARVYSRMGELDKAFEWLDTSLQENDGELAFLNVHIRPNEPGTFGMAIRRDPRFEKVLQRVGLPQ